MSSTAGRELVFVSLEPHTLRGDKWKVSSPTNVSRAKIPGGWLVGIESGNVRAWGLTFVPDPTHEWDGGSLP